MTKTAQQYKKRERIIARTIASFSSSFEFSNEWRKGDGWQNWMYERGIFSAVMVNHRLWDIRNK
jgi:hypothetical protein